MAIKLPEFSAVRARVMLTLRPSTKLGRTTLWLGGLSVLFIVLRWITGSVSGSKLSGWGTFVTVVFAVCALWLTFRWAPRNLRPSTKLGRATLWLGGLSVFFIVLRWITGNAKDWLLGHDVRCWKGCNKGRYRQHRAQSRGPTLLKLHRPFSGTLLRFGDYSSKGFP